MTSPVNTTFTTGTTITSNWLNGANDHVNDLEPNAHTASHISNAPAGQITANNVQDAINQLGTYNEGGTGAVDRTLESKLQESISVKDFGAIGDGTADDTTAVAAAISYANTKLNGATIIFPDGTYKVSPNAITITNSNVKLVGSGKYNITILCVTGGTIFTFSGANYIEISNIGFRYAGTPAVTDLIFQITNSNHFRFFSLQFTNTSGVCVVGDSSGTNPSSDVTFDGCTGYIANISATMFTFNKGAGLWMSNCTLFCNSGVPVNNRTSTMTTATNCNALQFGAYSWDSVQIVNCQFEQFYYGINVSTSISAANPIINDFYISNSIFDYCSSTALNFSSNNTVGGGIFGIRISNVWLASWSGDCIDIIGAGICQGFTLDSVQFISAGYNGTQIGGGTQKDIILNNISIGAVNRIAGVANGIYVSSGDRITVTNCRGGYDQTPLGFAWQATIGLNIANTVTNFLASNNHIEGASYNYYPISGGNTTGWRVSNNIGANYSGRQTTGIYTVPTSTTTWTNTAPYDVEVTIGGGTVTAISKNSVSIGSTSACLLLSPGDSYAMTYSVAPTVNYFVKQ